MNPENVNGYVKRKLDAVGIPYGYRRFKGEEIPDIPYILYFFERERFSGTDARNRLCRSDVVIELYTAKKEFALEEAIEAQFVEHEIEKSEDFDDADEVFRVTYEFSVSSKIRQGGKYVQG